MGVPIRYITATQARNKIEIGKDDQLWLNGAMLLLKFGRRGVQIGCTFVTYGALDKIYQESQGE